MINQHLKNIAIKKLEYLENIRLNGPQTPYQQSLMDQYTELKEELESLIYTKNALIKEILDIWDKAD